MKSASNGPTSPATAAVQASATGASLLADLERWRAELARAFVERNAGVSSGALTSAVHRTIDRIVFLRICEDRGVEAGGSLLAIAGAPHTYDRLRDRFMKVAQRYGVVLAPPRRERPEIARADDLTPALAIDDKPLQDILKSLYRAESPFQRSAVSPDILGRAYEQFLGSSLRLAADGRAAISPKPEVRKAGGVYYTPPSIVQRIVRRTLGRYLEGKTPQEVAGFTGASPPSRARTQLRIVDPACGSGAFLLEAYRYLLDWYRDSYLASGPSDGRLAGDRLTEAERRRVLRDHIFGVDIDAQAIQVTILSLLLTCLEAGDERALPDLSDNIKCGNSLIRPDFFDAPAKSDKDRERRLAINPFDWRAEFPSVFDGPAAAGGGFDVTIGNPPYVLLQDELRDDEQLDYFRRSFRAASYKIDTYHLFIERSIAITRPGGYVSMITPSNFLTNNHLTALRKLLLTETQIEEILVIDGGVFDGISVDNAIFVARPGAATSSTFRVEHASPDARRLHRGASIAVDAKAALADPYVLFTGSSSSSATDLWKKAAAGSVPLGQIAHVNFGKQLRDRAHFPGDVITVDGPRSRVKPPYRPCYTGRDVHRFRAEWGGLACLNDDEARRGGCWDPEKQDAKNKLVTRQIGRHPEFALDRDGYQCLNTMFMINVIDGALDPRFLLGILNSKLIAALWLDRFYDHRRTFPKIKGEYLKQLPIRVVDEADPAQRDLRDQIVAVVDFLLDAPSSASPRAPQEITAHDRQRLAAEGELNRLVNQLYRLSEAEIHAALAAMPRDEPQALPAPAPP